MGSQLMVVVMETSDVSHHGSVSDVSEQLHEVHQQEDLDVDVEDYSPVCDYDDSVNDEKETLLEEEEEEIVESLESLKDDAFAAASQTTSEKDDQEKEEVEDVLELKEKLKKKASVVFERKDSDGFWSNSARNSVTNMFETISPADVASSLDSPNDVKEESPRRILQKKRSSLSHKPDPALLFSKPSQEDLPVHEFQKVMSGLKPVDNQHKDKELNKKLSEDQLDTVKIGDKEIESHPGKDKKSDMSTDNKSIKIKKSKESKVEQGQGERKKELKEETKKTTSGSRSLGSNVKKPVASTNSGKIGAKSSVRDKNKTTNNDGKQPQAPSSDKRTVKVGIQSQSSVKKLNSSGSSTSVTAKPRSQVSRTMSLNSGANAPKANPSSSNIKSELRRSASVRKNEGVSSSGPKASDIPDNSVTFRSRTRKNPPPVPPKPRSGNKIDLKDLALTTGAEQKVLKENKKQKPASLDQKIRKPADSSKDKSAVIGEEKKPKSVKPVMKKMIEKKSIAEIARLADTCNAREKEDVQDNSRGKVASAGQFVSHAQATLSPAPTRKQRKNIIVSECDESDGRDEGQEEIEEESGIVSESVSASSVILMFGGTGKFKKSPSSQVTGENLTDTDKLVEKQTVVSDKTVCLNSDSTKKQSLVRKKSSIGDKQGKKSSNSRKNSRKDSERKNSGSVIKTSLTVRLKNVKKENDGVKFQDEETFGKGVNLSQSNISLSPSKSRQ